MSSELRSYDVTVGRHRTTMRLSNHDAAALGDAAVPVEERVRPPRPDAPAAPASGKSRLVTSNKMRGTDDKPDANPTHHLDSTSGVHQP